MGMLNRVLASIGEAGEKIGQMKLKQISEEELLDKKAAIEEAREQRILEAQKAIRQEDRGWHLQDKADDRTNKLADTADERNYQSGVRKEGYDNQKGMLTLGHQLGRDDAAYNHQLSREDADHKQQLENDPNSIDYKVKASSLGAHDLQMKESQLKLDQAQKIADLTDKATDPSISQEERQALLDEIQTRSGKKDSAGSMKVISVGTGEFVDGKEVTRNYLAQQDKKGNVNIVDPKSMIKSSFVDKDAANKKAEELVDLELQAEKVTKPEGGSMGWGFNNQKDNADIAAYEKERAARISRKTLELMGVDKSSDSGMLNKTPSKPSKGKNFNVFNITSTKGGFEEYGSVDEAVSELSDYIDRRATKGAVQGAEINKWLAEAGHPQDESLGGKINSVERYLYAYAPPKDKHGNVINNTEAYVKNAVAMVNAQLPDGQKISRDAPIDITDPLIKRGLMLAIGAQEGEDAWKTHNKEFIEAIQRETLVKPQQTANAENYSGFKVLGKH